MKKTIEILKYLYLSYVNDFLTVTRWADFHGIHPDCKHRILSLGRALHERGVQQYKESLTK